MTLSCLDALTPLSRAPTFLPSSASLTLTHFTTHHHMLDRRKEDKQSHVSECVREWMRLHHIRTALISADAKEKKMTPSPTSHSHSNFRILTLATLAALPASIQPSLAARASPVCRVTFTPGWRQPWQRAWEHRWLAISRSCAELLLRMHTAGGFVSPAGPFRPLRAARDRRLKGEL